jgi:UDP-N-acetylglucosamine diphosphorylase/glucosamine-1-phosphate N-acetyltransferase
MDNILLFETENQHLNLLPLSYTRPIADFRVGILTIREKWERYIPGAYSYRAVEYLSHKFPAVYAESNWYINAALLPTPELVKAILALGEGEALVKSGLLLAAKGDRRLIDNQAWKAVEFYQSVDVIEYLFDVFGHNAEEISRDYQLLTVGKESAPLSETNIVIGPKVDEQGRPLIFLEEGASVEAATLNTKYGPIYIGAEATVMEGSNLRGPIALCEHATINMGSKIYPGTTIGPHCKVGGEINNAVIFGFSNKAHDGYLGNAVIGEWCNIGAGTNASNLKNDYSKIRIWNYAKRTFMRTDLQFCGLMMGDHSKIGINGMLNTATVIGVGVNLHGSGFPRVFIPSFSQGSPSGGFTDVPLNKFFDIAERAMARRAIKLSDDDKTLFECIAQKAAEFK